MFGIAMTEKDVEKPMRQYVISTQSHIPEPPVPRIQFLWVMLQFRVPGKQLKGLPMESSSEIIPAVWSSRGKNLQHCRGMMSQKIVLYKQKSGE